MNRIDQGKATILEQALSFSSKEARDAYLQGACGEDAELRARMDALVKAHLAAGDFLEQEAPGTATTQVSPSWPEEGPGTAIGRYKLLQQIGEGGMGVVYMAEQEEPVRRRVALKIIKLGMDTKQVVARFEAERQALALMDHPNIAKVLDGGATESGRPYFVMELVRGVAITEYCDKNRLPTSERLDLFIQVCHAIQHAHQKGVIHRDLKPSNILVTLHDGVPLPMVIDFGIAKATNQRLTDKTLFTNFATMIGTPAYMSPEQAEMSKLDVDTRTDIYSLGVLLYELLTGVTPFAVNELLNAGFGEMQRILAEREPIRPSTRLSTMAHEERTVIARNRSLEPSALGRLFRGDLDWIVMKCLEKDRTRRYETTNGLAMDIQRFVRNEPVLARPPSATYRFQKLVRRHKLAFAAGALVSAALVLGLVATTWQAVRARRAELAQTRLLEKADQALANETAARKAADAAGLAEREQRQRAESRRYAWDINLAQRALEENNFGRVRELLDQERPRPGEEDRRGWEWRYLWDRSRSDEFIELGSASYVSSMAISHDQKYLAFGHDGGLVIRDISNLHNPKDLTQLPIRMPVTVAFSPTAALLAYTSVNWTSSVPFTTLVFWNVETRTPLTTLSIPGWCTSLAFSADGQTLATLSGDWDPDREQVDLWSFPSGRQVASFTVSPPDSAAGIGKKLALTPDLKLAAVGGKRLKVIDLTNGKELWRTNCDPETWGFECLALSPDSKTLVSSGGRRAPFPSIAIWDMVSGKEIGPWLKELQSTSAGIDFTPDGKTLVVAGPDQSVHLWDISDPARLHPRGRPLRGHRSGVITAALAADGKTLLTYAADYSIYAWNIERIEPEPGMLNWTNVSTWAFGPESGSIVIAQPTGEVTEWRGPDFQSKTTLLRPEPDSNHDRDAWFSEDGRWFALTYTKGEVKIWDLRQRSLRCRLNTKAESPAICGFSPDGKHVLIWGSSDEIVEWDLIATNRLRSWPLPKNTFSVSADPTWRWLIQRSERPADSLSLIEMASGESRALTPQLHRVLAVAASRDGKLMAASSFLGSVRIWQMSTLQEVCTLGDFQSPLYSVGFSSDLTRVLTASAGRQSIQLYDLKNQQELLSLPTDRIKTWDARFSPDGNMIGFLSSWVLHVLRVPSWAEIEAAARNQEALGSSKLSR